MVYQSETVKMAANEIPKTNPAVHIVYTEQPGEGEEPEAYHLRTLASVLGRYHDLVLRAWFFESFGFFLVKDG